MSEAANTHTPSRRRLLAAAPAVLALSGAAAAASAAPSPDTELIRVCHRFAEAELASWYRYVVAPDHLADAQDVPPDWNSLHWIKATPATTPEGWQAKALALSAWHRDAFDDPEDDREGHTPLLASLLRDMVRPARDAIVARLVERHEPLPAGYSVNGMWLGRAVA